MLEQPTDREREVSRRTLNRALFNLGHVRALPANDDELMTGLYKALRPIVGGSDGIAAAVALLKERAG